MNDPLGWALMLAFDCIHNTVRPYIDGPINMTIEAEVHNLINENLQKIDCQYNFSAQTIFNYDEEMLVTTLNGKVKGSDTIKTVVIKHRPKTLPRCGEMRV